MLVRTLLLVHVLNRCACVCCCCCYRAVATMPLPLLQLKAGLSAKETCAQMIVVAKRQVDASSHKTTIQHTFSVGVEDYTKIMTTETEWKTTIAGHLQRLDGVQASTRNMSLLAHYETSRVLSALYERYDPEGFIREVKELGFGRTWAFQHMAFGKIVKAYPALLLADVLTFSFLIRNWEKHLLNMIVSNAEYHQ